VFRNEAVLNARFSDRGTRAHRARCRDLEMKTVSLTDAADQKDPAGKGHLEIGDVSSLIAHDPVVKMSGAFCHIARR